MNYRFSQLRCLNLWRLNLWRWIAIVAKAVEVAGPVAQLLCDRFLQFTAIAYLRLHILPQGSEGGNDVDHADKILLAHC